MNKKTVANKIISTRLVVSLFLTLGVQVHAATQAKSANSFLNALGAQVVHGSNFTTDTIPQIATELSYAGVRIIRCSVDQGPLANTQILAQSVPGVKAITGPGNMNLHSYTTWTTAGIASFVSSVQPLATAGVLYGIEGPNEPLWAPGTYNGLTAGGTGSNWSPVAQLMQDLFADVKNDSILNAYPVLNTTTVWHEDPNVGLQFATGKFDLYNSHIYMSTENYLIHSGPYANNLVWNQTDPIGGYWGTEYITTYYKLYAGFGSDTAGALAARKCATETGARDDAYGSVDTVMQGKGALNIYLGFFAHGYEAICYFMLNAANGPAGDYTHYAMFNLDHTPKPAGTYVHNLTTILNDSADGNPGQVNYSFPNGKPSTVHDLLLQKSTGRFELIIWDDRPSGSAAEAVTVNLGQTFQTVTTYDPTVGTTATAVAPNASGTFSNISSLTLNMTDHPVIIELPATGSAMPSSWASQDIGTVGVAGATTYASDTQTFTLAGSGADISGTSDAFQYAYQQVSGDCAITARLVTQTNQSTSALAGVMIRETLAPGSKHAFMWMRPLDGLRFTKRTTTDGSTSSSVSGGAGTPPQWLRLVRSGSTFTSYKSSDGIIWTQVTSTTITMGTSVYVGLAQCSHINTTLGTATFDNVTVSTNLPAPWTNQDIGAVGVAGSAAYAGGAFTVNGSGADISGTADAFQYVYQPVTGDCSITARLVTQTNQSTSAIAGVMIRETLAPGSTHAFMWMRPLDGFRFTKRLTTDGTTPASVFGGAGTPPQWLRLVRSGSTFTGYKSSDGSTWTQVSSATITMGTNVYVGLAQCSHINTTLGTAVFDNVTVVP